MSAIEAIIKSVSDSISTYFPNARHKIKRR